MVNYRHLFFDLDRTLWDFERNSTETIVELLSEFKLDQLNDKHFVQVYKAVNFALWQDYRSGEISKDELRQQRFYQTLLKFNIDESNLALEFNDIYVKRCSTKPHLIPYSLEILNYLKRKYDMHIITNGFSEAQSVKLEKSGISGFFRKVIVADELGVKKPDPAIFFHALECTSAEVDQCIMIGDDFETDIVGARDVGIDQVFFNPGNSANEGKEATFTIGSLEELEKIL